MTGETLAIGKLGGGGITIELATTHDFESKSGIASYAGWRRAGREMHQRVWSLPSV